MGAAAERGAGQILIIDDDRDIVEIARAVLVDEGFLVSTMMDGTSEMVRTAVNQLEPDCVLLDGESPVAYGRSWEEAAWLSQRARPVPVIMFTAGGRDIAEAQDSESERSVAAGFASIISKPFDLDELVDLVRQAVGQSVPFDASVEGEARRTTLMVERAQALGARNVHASTRREWLNFETEDGTLVQVYYWQRDGVYYVIRHPESGGALENLGHFYDLETALVMAMTVRQSC
jgi:CheY-like chemotaxis protein